MKQKKKPNPKAKPSRKPKYTSEEIKSFQQTALELYKEDIGHALELGRALLKVREAMKHGEFQPWWKASKLSQARVSYCMRLAQGKIKAAKIKVQRKPERVAMSNVKKEVDSFLQFFADEKKCKTLDQLTHELDKLLFFTVGQCSKIRHWPLVTPDMGNTFQTAKASRDSLSQALEQFLKAAFVPVDFDDLERISANSNGSRPYSEHLKDLAEFNKHKKPPQSETAVPKTNPAKANAATAG